MGRNGLAVAHIIRHCSPRIQERGQRAERRFWARHLKRNNRADPARHAHEKERANKASRKHTTPKLVPRIPSIQERAQAELKPAAFAFRRIGFGWLGLHGRIITGRLLREQGILAVTRRCALANQATASGAIAPSPGRTTLSGRKRNANLYARASQARQTLRRSIPRISAMPFRDHRPRRRLHW
jgi:hypothetical protein